ncbi:hypothetical protein L596_006121 [Steinernema carpocapsae]|uniref:Uncharacterized protein n=1 Tax=Steinernema carpocapsae TaxID=34508 RepID=A0A4U8V8D6_STECR|nr:hypothetical protein L596_006121 [Steinernema carpocapsae]
MQNQPSNLRYVFSTTEAPQPQSGMFPQPASSIFLPYHQHRGPVMVPACNVLQPTRLNMEKLTHFVILDNMLFFFQIEKNDELSVTTFQHSGLTYVYMKTYVYDLAKCFMCSRGNGKITVVQMVENRVFVFMSHTGCPKLSTWEFVYHQGNTALLQIWNTFFCYELFFPAPGVLMANETDYSEVFCVLKPLRERMYRMPLRNTALSEIISKTEPLFAFIHNLLFYYIGKVSDTVKMWCTHVNSPTSAPPSECRIHLTGMTVDWLKNGIYKQAFVIERNLVYFLYRTTNHLLLLGMNLHNNRMAPIIYNVYDYAEVSAIRNIQLIKNAIFILGEDKRKRVVFRKTNFVHPGVLCYRGTIPIEEKNTDFQFYMVFDAQISRGLGETVVRQPTTVPHAIRFMF